jgi:hypothetical protein
MRATRDLLRRRRYLMRTRAALLTHLQNTTSQDHLPDIGKKIASQAKRDGVAERCSAPAGHKSIAVDRARLGHDDQLRRHMEVALLNTATPHPTNQLDWRHTVPGSGDILSLGLLDDIHAIARCPWVPAFMSYCRRVTCATEAAGTRYGTTGTTSGNASLTWAFSDAAVLCLQDHPAGQTQLTRVEQTHGQGNTLTVLAHPLARALYLMLNRPTAFELDQVLHG